MEAGEIADWYGYRPIVEELHKGMKTGCGVETLQFTTEAALQPVIALLSVVAVFLLGLRDAARDPATAARPATQFVPVSYAEVLCSWRHGEVRPGWTVGEFYWALGRLGGPSEPQQRPAPGLAGAEPGLDAIAGDGRRGGGHGTVPGTSGCARKSGHLRGRPTKLRGTPGLREPYCTNVIGEIQA